MSENNHITVINNVEWALVIGTLFAIDLIQIILDLLIIGTIFNRFIDIFVGLGLALYLHLRGQSLANPKRLAGLIGAFGIEMIPGADALPFWGLDGIYHMLLSKSEAKRARLHNIPPHTPRVD